MSHKPRVSVVMVTLNREKYLAEAVDSVLRQTYGDWELILSDGGSKDRSLDIMREYAARDERIRVFVHPGTNAAEARNASIGEAVGEYVAILDSDDIALPERLRMQVEYLDAHPSVAGLGTGFYFASGRGWAYGSVARNLDRVEKYVFSGNLRARR